MMTVSSQRAGDGSSLEERLVPSDGPASSERTIQQSGTIHATASTSSLLVRAMEASCPRLRLGGSRRAVRSEGRASPPDPRGSPARVQQLERFSTALQVSLPQRAPAR